MLSPPYCDREAPGKTHFSLASFLRRSIAVFGGVGWLILALGLGAGGTAWAQSNEFRALWVDAWGDGFLNANQVSQLIADCRANNFNAVIVQMRRRGDAFYNQVLPGNDPKTTAIPAHFDALADILAKARTGSPRIEVHCWVATFTVWSSEGTAPPQAGHVFNRHPEYLMRNSAGKLFIGEGYYLDPGHPDAMFWNFAMATNIVRQYDVDGFHWDLVRYPTRDSGYNPTAIARYNEEFGTTGQPLPADARFGQWRRRQVTDFLRWVNAELLAIRPRLQISCAVLGNRTDAYQNRFQDWAAWNQEGIIDLCMPMGYTAANSTFNAMVEDTFNHQGVRRVYQGQGAYLNTKENTVYQLTQIRNKPLFGSVLFSYRATNPSPVDRPGTFAYIKQQHQPVWVEPPPLPWKASPTKGILRGTVTRQADGQPLYNAQLTLDTSPARTQETGPHGQFAFFETPPGTHTLTATARDLGTVTTNITIAAGENLAVTLALPLDNTPPVFSQVGTSNLTDTAVIIHWATDDQATSAVDYGLTTAYGATVEEGALTASHALRLANLTPNTTYHYRVRSRNTTGLSGVSRDFVFQTQPAGVINDVIIESRLPSGDLNVYPPYTDAGFLDSTLKSTAPGLSGTGSRYATAGTPNFTITPTLPVPGGAYDVFLTHGRAASISDDILVAVTQTGSSGLPALTPIFREPGGNTWEYLGRMVLGADILTPTVKFTYAGGTLDSAGNGRMYSDAIKFVFVPHFGPPLLHNYPTDRTVRVGAATTFNVIATGAMPLSYSWRFNGVAIPGKTASHYVLENVQPQHVGHYSVVITNTVGAVTSSPALLQVDVPPPAQLTASQLADGRLRLQVQAEPGRYRVEAAATMPPADWVGLIQVTNETTQFEFTDSETNLPRRFYRTQRLPP
ncbi:MAG: family 10 glycosylhydrolase [Verrucomicrobia bacterium]|nr:family 10 glycosylhydrolase [Verrucomicrobiota bacterium]